MPFERRDSSGNAAETTIVTTVGPSDVTMTLLDSSGWPTGGLNGPFFAEVETEVIKFELRNGTLLTVAAGGRGWDSTLAGTHQAGAGISHVFTRTDGDEANYAVSQTVGLVGGAGQTLAGSGPNTFQVVPAGTEGQFYKFVGGVPVWDTLDSTDMSDYNTATDARAVTVAQAQIRALIQAGANLTLTDNGTTLTLAAPTEGIQDIVGAMIAATGGLTFTYDDGAGTITVSLPDSIITSAKIVDGTIVQGDVASTYMLHRAQTSLPTAVPGLTFYDTDDDLLYVCNSSSQWVCITPVHAFAAGTVNTADTSAAGVPLSGGPTVTVFTGAKALVTVGCNISNNNVGSGAGMGVTVSGASTKANTGDTQVYVNHVDSGDNYTYSHTFEYTDLTPGTNVFTAAYHTGGSGTGAFISRKLTVVGIP